MLVIRKNPFSEKNSNKLLQSLHSLAPNLKKKNIKIIYRALIVPFFLITFWLDKFVDFKSDYNKTKISEMDISNIYLKNESFEIFA